MMWKKNGSGHTARSFRKRVGICGALLLNLILFAGSMSSASASPGRPADVCPKSSDVQFQFEPLNSATITTERKVSPHELATGLCKLFDEMDAEVQLMPPIDPSAPQARADLNAIAPFFKALVTAVSTPVLKTAACGTLNSAVTQLENTDKAYQLLAAQERVKSLVGPPAAGPAMVPGAEPGAAGGVSLEVALAKVLAKRAQEEFKAWFIDGIMSDICGGEAKGYFPQFCALYQPIVSAPIPSYDTLSKAFQKDLKDLPPCVIWKNSKDGSGNGWGYVAMNLFRSYRGGSTDSSPVQWLAGLADTPYVKRSCTTGKEDSCAFYLGSTTAFAYLTSARDAEKNILPTELVARTYIKLKKDKKYQLIRSITPKFVVNGHDVLRNYALHIEYFSSVVEEIKQRIEKIKSLKPGDPSYEEDALQLSIELGEKVVEAVEESVKVIRNEDISVRFAYKKDDEVNIRAITSEDYQLERIRTIARVVSSLQSKQYGAVMADTTRVLFCISQDTPPKDAEDACMPWNDVREAVQKRLDCAGAEASEKGKCEELAKKTMDALRFMTRYTPVAAEIAAAKTTEELNQALDRAAAPVGAWRLKRDRPMASLGGLVGWTYGSERLEAPDGTILRGRYSALFAPVGVDLSCPIKNSNYTMGLFLSLIDVGNLMSFDSSQNEALKVQEDSHVTFRDVYSPGIYARLGLGKSPFVLGFGIAKTPGLRTAERPDGSTAPLDSVRISAFIAMDITLFPF